MEKNSQESSEKCSLLFLFSPPRHCIQSEIRIYCHFADDSRSSDLLSQKNNESSAQSTVKHGLGVALFPCLPIYLRTVKSIMSINAYKLAGRRWVDISNPEQVPDVFSEINSFFNSTTFQCVYLADEDPLAQQHLAMCLRSCVNMVANPVMNTEILTPTPLLQIHFLSMLHRCCSDDSQEADVFVGNSTFLAVTF